MRIKLVNTYHNTECFLTVKSHNYVTKTQVKKAWATLCGIKDCSCCNPAGQRGCNVHLEFNPDGSAWISTGDD